MAASRPPAPPPGSPNPAEVARQSQVMILVRLSNTFGLPPRRPRSKRSCRRQHHVDASWRPPCGDAIATPMSACLIAGRRDAIPSWPRRGRGLAAPRQAQLLFRCDAAKTETLPRLQSTVRRKARPALARQRQGVGDAGGFLTSPVAADRHAVRRDRRDHLDLDTGA